AAEQLRLDRRTAGRRHCRIDEPHDHGCSGTQARHHDGPMALQSLQESLYELYPAVAFGADGVEHIRGTSRRGYSPKVTAMNHSYSDVIDLLTHSKMSLTLTVEISGGFALAAYHDPTLLNDPRFDRLFPSWVVRNTRTRWMTQIEPRTLVRVSGSTGLCWIQFSRWHAAADASSQEPIRRYFRSRSRFMPNCKTT